MYIIEHNDLSFFHNLPTWCSDAILPFDEYESFEEWNKDMRRIINASITGEYKINYDDKKLMRKLNTMRMFYNAMKSGVLNYLTWCRFMDDECDDIDFVTLFKKANMYFDTNDIQILMEHLTNWEKFHNNIIMPQVDDLDTWE